MDGALFLMRSVCKQRSQPGVRRLDQLRKHFGISDGCHVVGIAGPAWYNVLVDMIRDARPRGPSLIDPNVKAVG